MIDYLKEVASNSNTPTTEKPPKPSQDLHAVRKPADSESYADVLKNGAQQGHRNHSAAKLIGHLLGKGNDESVIWEMVKQWNAAKNNPPLDENELRKTFDSIKDLNAKNGKKEKEKKDVDVDTVTGYRSDSHC